MTAFKRFYILIILGLPAWILPAFAQVANPCQDEMMINPYYSCGTVFEPVCACNGVSYRNQCAARYQGGIQGNQWASGPCQDFFFFIYPSMNLTGNLIIQMQYRDRGRSTLYVIDNFGHFVHQRQVEAGNSFPLQIELDVSVYPVGIYYLLIRGENYQQLDKFIVLHN